MSVTADANCVAVCPLNELKHVWTFRRDNQIHLFKNKHVKIALILN